MDLRLSVIKTNPARELYARLGFTKVDENQNEYFMERNIVCLEGGNPFDLGDVVTNDGVNHPADR